MVSIRGAITVNEDSVSDIIESTKVLLMSIIEENHLAVENIISIYFTATQDITKAYPAVAAREVGLTECSLLCGQEMYVEGSLKKCIRVMMHVESDNCQKNAKHVYLREAKKLRPDLLNN